MKKKNRMKRSVFKMEHICWNAPHMYIYHPDAQICKYVLNINTNLAISIESTYNGVPADLTIIYRHL